MKTFFAMTKRNVKLFFKDKGMFFSSLITPVILLVLYATFLAKVYKDTFQSAIPEGFKAEGLSSMIDGMVGAMLVSSLLAVSCVTVAFCSNLIMVQDKFNGVKKDFMVTPVKRSVLSLSYYFGTLINTLAVGLIATALGFVYLACVGWYMSFTDVLLFIVDVIILSTFGTALSSIVNSFLSTQGQMSAVGTIVSAGYGFICGAYMPISQFGDVLRNVLSFLPGTYGTSLIKNHALNGVFNEMVKKGFPTEVISGSESAAGIKESVDCTIKFFGTEVSEGACYAVMLGSILLLIAVFVLINVLKDRKRKNKKEKAEKISA